jgi:hypothetical protein
MKLNELLEKIKANPSTNEKIKILEGNKDFPLLKMFFKLACDPDIVFYIKKIPPYKKTLRKTDLESGIPLLINLAKRNLTGNNAKKALGELLGGLTNNDDKVIIRIIKKDPDCGVGITTVNKIWPDLIRVWPYQRCSAHNEKNLTKINWPAFVERKANGMFINTIVTPSEVTHLTREGKQLHLHANFKTLLIEIKSPYDKGFVILGEGEVLHENGHMYPRKKGNGLLSRSLHKNLSPEIAKNVRLSAWTIIPLQDWKNGLCEIPYKTRRKILRHLILHNGLAYDKVNLIHQACAETEAKMRKFFDRMIEMEEEGAIVKNRMAIWKSRGKTPSPDEVKIKIPKECELACVGTYPHKKHPDLIGGLELESSCGNVKVNVGSGLSKKDREKSEDYWIGTIITVWFAHVITSKQKTTHSLYEPRMVEERFDKSEADDLKYIQQL